MGTSSPTRSSGFRLFHNFAKCPCRREDGGGVTLFTDGAVKPERWEEEEVVEEG